MVDGLTGVEASFFGGGQKLYAWNKYIIQCKYTACRARLARAHYHYHVTYYSRTENVMSKFIYRLLADCAQTNNSIQS